MTTGKDTGKVRATWTCQPHRRHVFGKAGTRVAGEVQSALELSLDVPLPVERARGVRSRIHPLPSATRRALESAAILGRDLRGRASWPRCCTVICDGSDAQRSRVPTA